MSARPTLPSTVTGWSAALPTAAVVAQNAAAAVIYALLMEAVLAPQWLMGLSSTPIWPANGFALAGVWLLGPRVLPGVAAGAFLVMVQEMPLAVALIGPLAPVAQVWLATLLLRRAAFDERLERVTRQPRR